MNVLINLPDDHIPGRCHDCFGNVKCPFASRGCYAKDPAKCPLLGARKAVYLNDSETKASIYAGKPAELFCVMKMKGTEKGK